ncbi:TetR/AcrR family transcriptional regulator [Luteibacter yeojuensis]|uniref:TetR family transcriptional regulator n=1 Tax=Luteibacter yeojuensis TaxID=345309 RepID=A0A0F3K525_9GAMM|nr:TetR/AcrR family transcriptional regulator [Luteibacter yeojuensis]KJV26286.1 TetR family transcriptional regulator [Luteibacter yeojuensis]
MRADAQKNYALILSVARDVVAEQGADASLRDIARRADVGLGTLYRHFPSREALFDVLLRSSLDQLTGLAAELEAAHAPDEALVAWARDAVAWTQQFRGVVDLMAAAMDDETSPLYVACKAVRSSGARLLARAQAEGTARKDIDGADFLALIAGLAWLGEQAAFAPRAPHLFGIVTGALLGAPAKR